MATGLPEGVERRADAVATAGTGPELREVRIRPMEEGDVTRVAEIERAVFTTPWRADTFRRLLGRTGVDLRVAELGEEGAVGYTVLWSVGDEGELANIAVLEEYRGRGLGRRLLKAALEEAQRRGVKNLYLEVRVSNERAAEMYRRSGFEEVARRRAYYDRPREDALVLVKRL